MAEAESAAKAEYLITLPPDEQQNRQSANMVKAARELEWSRPGRTAAGIAGDGDKPDPLLSASDERRLRDLHRTGNPSWMKLSGEAVAEGREPRQQVRDQMRTNA
ncbi:hypothetical protein KCP76_26100 (plasmid) [Salmonella enterica subsp. enterica serovar Weltevreden]|nr:hypothetical protein KCP76_26100 [Salmonella enterica subsp. enterica serovar Weltevreden]QUI99508.1 hypothetical protein KCP74_25525 [Salmonella enterica subsp. enterica]QUJ01278.1 hypothetical protein KCP73_26840 [Salmonella enterica subsp. enterica]